jgi:ABC-2 type transport system ATP-binding protein/lipopolysaccharide transport system ATP-binding protein
MQPLVVLEDVSVTYRLPKDRIRSLKEFWIHLLKGRLEYEDYSALNGVNLDVRPGDALGLIGKNGSGKSTLLKVIAGVIKPIHGTVQVNGKVAPLLELGAGFDFEMTGLENIYLNGSILGYSRREMDAKVSGIVEFSELGDFIRAPLRTYSSGMIARLGFAIATDADPDVLLVDEVLSVGDGAFTKKCESRISSYRDAQVSLMLVSHDMNKICALCDKAVWLNRGQICASGNAADVTSEYEKFLSQSR